MPMIIELVIVVVVMLVAFFLVFLAMFMLAMFLSPIERSLSKMIWDMKAPKQASATPAPVKTGSFKDFSKKH